MLSLFLSAALLSSSSLLLCLTCYFYLVPNVLKVCYMNVLRSMKGVDGDELRIKD